MNEGEKSRKRTIGFLKKTHQILQMVNLLLERKMTIGGFEQVSQIAGEIFRSSYK